MQNEKVVMRCSNCVFWEMLPSKLNIARDATKYDVAGLCYRYPPVANLIAAKAEVDEAISEAEDEDASESVVLHQYYAPYESLSETYTWVRPVTWSQAFCGEFRSEKINIDPALIKDFPANGL